MGDQTDQDANDSREDGSVIVGSETTFSPTQTVS